jgi:hypothetical protein
VAEVFLIAAHGGDCPIDLVERRSVEVVIPQHEMDLSRTAGPRQLVQVVREMPGVGDVSRNHGGAEVFLTQLSVENLSLALRHPV